MDFERERWTRQAGRWFNWIKTDFFIGCVWMIPASGTLIFVIEKIYVALAPIAAETPFVRLGKGVAA